MSSTPSSRPPPPTSRGCMPRCSSPRRRAAGPWPARLQPGLNLLDSIRESPGLTPGGVLTIKQVTNYNNICNLRLETCRPEFQMNFRPQASKQATCNLPSGIPNEFPSARIIFALVRTILPPRGTKLDSTQQTWIQLSLKTFLFPTTGSRLDSHASQFVTPSGPALMVRPRSHPNTPCRHCRYCHRYRQHHSRLQKPHESATEQHSRECDRPTLTRVRPNNTHESATSTILDSTCRTQSGKAPVSIRAVF